ncbi:hypothetical protein FRB97_007177 [Tulasnella sp. 331]|nr:hypothetical protein FRB97_007177 [Tulasnella sp. 331]
MQAQEAHTLQTRELESSIPVPTRLFSSSLHHAAHTHQLTSTGIVDFQSNPPLLVEGLRGAIGQHTCDRRSSKSAIQAAFPDHAIEAGSTEEDNLWMVDYREKDTERDARVLIAIDKTFSEVNDPCE